MALFGGATVLGGCNEKLQEHTTVLLDALPRNDFAAVRAIAGPELAAELDADAFAQISAEYGELGPLRDKRQSGTGIRNDRRWVTYQLEFEGGDEVSLEAVSRTGNDLDGFAFDGPDWKRATQELQRRRLAEWLDALARPDREAAAKLWHVPMPEDDLDALIRRMAPHGPPKSVTMTSEDPLEFEVVCEHATFDARVQLRGGKVSFFSVVPR